LFELPSNDSLRKEICRHAVCNLLYWVLFDWTVCTVVLFTLLLAVTQRNLRSLCKSGHVSCKTKTMMGVCEVWSHIERKDRVFTRPVPTKMILPLQSWDFNVKNRRGGNCFRNSQRIYKAADRRAEQPSKYSYILRVIRI